MDPEQLIAAIRAALDETERKAREVGGAWRLGIVYGTVFDATAGVTVASTPYEAAAQHITHNGPAAVLRRVAADREILAEHAQVGAECQVCSAEPVMHVFYDSETEQESIEWERADMPFPCPTVRALACGLGIDLEETP